jgi:hypothetical protein
MIGACGGVLRLRKSDCINFSVVETHYSGDLAALLLAFSARVEEKYFVLVVAGRGHVHFLNPDVMLVYAIITTMVN